MHIHIEKYRNINDLDLDIDDGKVNFLFGVCGSGKSSVLTAISKDISANDATFGANIADVQVKVDGNDPAHENFTLYESSRKGMLFAKGPSAGTYEIFVGDESALIALERDYSALISELTSKISKLEEYQAKVSNLKKVFGAYGARGFAARSGFMKMKTALSEAGPYAKSLIAEHRKDYISWCADGLKHYEDQGAVSCPFCMKDKIPLTRLSELEEVSNLTHSDLAPFFDSREVLTSLSIPEPDLSSAESLNVVQDKIAVIHKASKEVAKLLAFCQMSRHEATLSQGLNNLEVDPILYAVFPDLENDVMEINTKSDQIKRILGRMKAAFQALVGNDSRSLNEKLKQLGIPYQIKAVDIDRSSRTSGYVLKHISDEEDTDRRESLSEGEKNLVALLLFLHHPGSNVILVDDPASSYDDYRRSQIFRIITEVKEKTILVVSHDQAFVRIASREKSSNSRIGRVQILSQGLSGVEVDEIDFDSYGYLREFITARVAASSNYYQKVINARLLCDLSRDEECKAWQYTSAIMHGTSREEVLKLLLKRGWTEAEVLLDLNEVIGCSFPTIPANYETVLPENASDFEFLIHAREMLKIKEAQQGLSLDEVLHQDLLNDLVHMNYCLAYCLDPYRFRTWAPSLNELCERTRTATQDSQSHEPPSNI